jgi:hypothetical protein
MRAIESAKSAALAAIKTASAAAAPTVAEPASGQLGSETPDTHRGDALQQVAPEPAPGAPAIVSNGAVSAKDPDESTPQSPSSSDAPAAQPPKRPRKTRRDEATESIPTEPQISSSPASPPQPAATVGQEHQTPPSVHEVPSVPADEPLPVPANTIPEIAPIAPNTAEPFSGHIATVPNGNTPAVASESPAAPSPVAPEIGKPVRKRAKKTEAEDEPVLGLDLNNTADLSTGMAERVPTSDGATRLLVTAYIGIGNRLYIRGNGPGLSWEKGVALQFVSIGKWRWETNDAIAPLEFKLYKNDDVECSALGSQLLEPGLQQEVTAAF